MLSILILVLLPQKIRPWPTSSTKSAAVIKTTYGSGYCPTQTEAIKTGNRVKFNCPRGHQAMAHTCAWPTASRATKLSRAYSKGERGLEAQLMIQLEAAS